MHSKNQRLDEPLMKRYAYFAAAASTPRILPVLAALSIAVQPAVAQQESPSLTVPVESSVSAAEIESMISDVESRTELDEETQGAIREQLRGAQVLVQRRLAAEADAQAYAESLANAPTETQALRTILDQDAPPAPTPASLDITEDTTLADVEQDLAQAALSLAAADSTFLDLESRIAIEETRPAQVRDELKKLDELRRNVATADAGISQPMAAEPQLLMDAREVVSNLRRSAKDAEIKALEQELLSQPVRLDLLKAQRELAERQQSTARARTELLRELANQKRQSTAILAQQAAEAAELAAVGKHPTVRSIAEVNAGLTSELPAVAADIEQFTAQRSEVEQEARAIERRLTQSRQRLEVGGVSQAIGQLLLQERRTLPQISRYRGQVRSRRNTLAEIGLAQVRIQEQLRGLTALDARVETAMDEVTADVQDEDELTAIRMEIRSLLKDRRSLLSHADNTYSSYLQALGDLDIAQRRLLDSVSEYAEFLAQNLMWIPSAPIIGMGTWRDVGPALAWAFSPRQWGSALPVLFESLKEQLSAAIFTILLLTALLISRRPLVRQYESMSSKVGRLSTDHIGLTVASLAIAAVMALPLPTLLASIAWFLQNGVQQSDLIKAIAAASFATAPFLYNVMLCRGLCAKGGVANAHFGWPERNLALVRRQLDRLVTIGAPLLFVTVLLYRSEVATDRATIGRLFFIALMVVLSMALRPLAHPERGVAAIHYQREPDNWISRFRWFWYAVLVGAPLMLALITMLGYLYTAGIITGLLIDTIWLLLAVIVIDMTVLRWLALARRRLAWQIELKAREDEQAESERMQDAETEDELPVIESKPLDLDAVDTQTRKLLHSGLFLISIVAGSTIWAEVVPAFGLLEQLSLWSQTAFIDGVETIVPVTMADLLLAVIVAGATAIASKNLPGLMEIVVLQRLTLQPGSRYAINTLLRYVVVTVGAVMVLNIIGWNWSQIQWLVAALSVGLGFGLQEIVANFVSGLVILFERPVRVGDTVTVGQITGTVSRVHIRATTITDWDRKEIIVPNKSFITEQVINWTLSDPITRVVVPVGIAYGSDVQLAHRVMEKTLHELPLVLDDPEPRAYFLGFGDSSLNFDLHVHSKQLADRLPLMHTVHEAILRALRDNGIEIPFPQRDLHVRSVADAAQISVAGRSDGEVPD
jgi:potassium efflux system protein